MTDASNVVTENIQNYNKKSYTLHIHQLLDEDKITSSINELDEVLHDIDDSEIKKFAGNQGGSVGELVGDIVDLSLKTLNMAKEAAGLADQADNEVKCAYHANTMYHTMQTAEELRASLDSGEFAKMKDPSYIDTAELDELKQFVNRLYAVYNFDMVGQAEYITLDNEWQYQTNEKYNEAMSECRELWGKVYEKHGAFLATMEYIGGGWMATYAYAWVGGQKSEYLKEVNKEARNGLGWLPLNSAFTVYDAMINLAESARIPDRFRGLI